MLYRFQEYPAIVVDPKVCTGKPHVQNTRITVAAILANLAGGMSIEVMLTEFPRLKKTDILQALAFASGQMQDQYQPLQAAA